MQISTLVGFSKVKKGVRYYLAHVPFALRCLAIACTIIVVARPRSSTELENVTTEGIDIMLVLDTSTSMLAMDFQPNRIEAAKNIATQFISERKTDRMGLVLFAGESFTQCPLTTDRVTLINLLQDVNPYMLEGGTAIGDGLATAVARLKNSDAISKVVILLTDGENNSGSIAPITAAEMAKLYNVRVYTIGMGSASGMASMPTRTIWGSSTTVSEPVRIDEKMLTEMATMTDGKYFRATSNTKLKEIYDEINQMEKTKTEVDSVPVYKEEFLPFALAALGLLLLELLLRLFVLRRIP